MTRSKILFLIFLLINLSCFSRNIENTIKKGLSFQNNGDYITAGKYYSKAYNESKRLKKESLTILIRYKQLLNWALQGKSDLVYIKTNELLNRINGNQKYKLVESNLKTLKSIIQSDLGIYDDAFEFLYKSSKEYKKKKISNYFGLGYIYQKEGSFSKANNAYNTALNLAKTSSSKSILIDAKMENFLNDNQLDSCNFLYQNFKKNISNYSIIRYLIAVKKFESAKNYLLKNGIGKRIDSSIYYYENALIEEGLGNLNETILNLQNCIKYDTLNEEPNLFRDAYPFLISKLKYSNFTQCNLNNVIDEFLNLLKKEQIKQQEKSKMRLNIIEKMIQFEIAKENLQKKIIIDQYKFKIIVLSLIFIIILSTLLILILRQKKKLINNELWKKEIELKEVQHRTNNNLQMISSVLLLESSKMKEKSDQTIFKESINKIELLTIIHQFLSKELENKAINIKPILLELENYFKLLYSSNNTHIINFEINNILLSEKKLIAIVMILNEFIINTFKHNREENKIVTVQILKKEKYHIIYKENGKGFKIKHEQGFGFKVIKQLCLQHKIQWIYQTENDFYSEMIFENEKNSNS